MHGWWQKVAIGAMVGWLGGVASAAEAPPKFVVVQPQEANKAGTYQSQARVLEATLGKAVGIVPLADYLRAGKTLGIKPLALVNDESAVAVGRMVGATHVLFLRPKAATPGAKRDDATLDVVLVDTATGASSYEGRVALVRGASAQSKTAQSLVAALAAAATAAPAAAVAVTPAAAPMAKASPGKSPAAPGPAAAPTEAPPAPAPVVVTAEPDTGPPSPLDAMGPLPPTPALVAPTPVPVAAVTEASADANVSYFAAERRMPHGLDVALGLMIYQRQALIGGELEYGPASSGGHAPLFARGTIDATVMPSRWRTHRLNFVDGLLAFVHMEMGPARTLQSNGEVATLGSYGFRLGGGYRAPLWKGPRAMAATFRLGFSQYLFGSHAGVPFPAVGLRGLLVGLGLEVPLGTRHVAIVADGAVVPAAKPFSSAKDLGDATERGLGGMVDAGLRLSFGPVDVRLLFAWERYSVRYAGQTHASNLLNSYQDTTLVDQTQGGKVQLGVHF